MAQSGFSDLPVRHPVERITLRNYSLIQQLKLVHPQTSGLVYRKIGDGHCLRLNLQAHPIINGRSCKRPVEISRERL